MQKLTKYLCGIIKQAAKITNHSFNVYNKDEFGDIVTDIDKEVETFLIKNLTQKYPEFDIVSEEFNPDHDLTTNCFVIDPIDGTKNFAAGIPLWGMQIAAIENGEVISSVIYLPKLDELYYADCDGAYLNNSRLEIIPENKNQRQIYSVDGKDKLSVLSQLIQEINRNIRHFSCASLTFAWVAAGRLTGYNFRTNKIWDYLPGMYLVKMAGGYTKDEPDLHVVANNQTIFEILCKYPFSSKTTIDTETNTTAKNKTIAKSTKKTNQSTKK